MHDLWGRAVNDHDLRITLLSQVVIHPAQGKYPAITLDRRIAEAVIAALDSYDKERGYVRVPAYLCPKRACAPVLIEREMGAA